MMDDDLRLAGDGPGAGFFGAEGADGAAALEPAVVGLVDELMAAAPSGPSGLLLVLLGIQRTFNRVSWRIQELVADRYGLSPAQVSGMVSYYPMLSSERRGRLRIEICVGTGCHLRHAEQVVENVTRAVAEDGTGVGESQKVSVEQVRCLGVCGLAPVVRTQGRVTPALGSSGGADLLRRVLESERSDRRPE